MRLAAVTAFFALNTFALALDPGVGILLYDPSAVVPAPAELFDIDARNVAAVMDAPASVKAYCKPGTLGTLPNEHGETDPVSIEGNFTKKTTQRLTVVPLCDHKLAGVYRNRVYGIAVSDVTGFGQPFRKPELVVYVFGKTGEQYGGPGQMPVRLGDVDGDGLNELGLKFDVGDTPSSHLIQVYRLRPSPTYLATVEQGFTSEVRGPSDFNAAIYAAPVSGAFVYIGAEFGSTFHTRILNVSRQELFTAVR